MIERLMRGYTHELVKKILTQPNNYQWTLQGFGMLRLNMENDLRMAIWSDQHRVPNVSLVHTHPWNFDSYIVCGQMRNERFIDVSTNPVDQAIAPYWRSVIVAGPGGGLEGAATGTWLRQQSVEFVEPGEVYSQLGDEIHQSLPVNGTVTLCQRNARRDDPDRALVFWEKDNEWVSAEPRPASPAEVSAIVAMAHEQLSHVNWTVEA